MKEFWNERYGQEKYAYGLLPNEFFKNQLSLLPSGSMLLPAEGEGRNAVYAALEGWDVEAFDFSDAAIKKALHLAIQNKVTINYQTSTFQDFKVKLGHYDAVGLIYVHMPSDQRSIFHQKMISSLRPGGKIILETFEKRQLGLLSGGPKSLDMLYSIEELEHDFASMKIEQLAYESTNLDEGSYHSGLAKVVRMVATKI